MCGAFRNYEKGEEGTVLAQSSLVRPRCRLKDNIIVYLEETKQPEDMT
jgi:hypothetical protein